MHAYDRCRARGEAFVIGSAHQSSGTGTSRRVRHIARQLLPPIVAGPLQRVVDRRRKPERPEWEYLPTGWPTGDSLGLGWAAESVMQTQLARWPAFIRSLEGPAPFGLSNEAEAPTPNDYGTHNATMTFGYVLARAAHGRSTISMLDWGGGIGHYCAYAKALLPEIKLDYHCRDLQSLTAAGRTVLPEATFHDADDSALARTYDLVLASSSLHYSQDWRTTLAQLSSATASYLYVTRQPFVEVAPSFVVVQRPHRHGYLTEYPGWFLNRAEFLAEAEKLGVALVREFLIAERPDVPGAPEQADYRGFLFAAARRGKAA